MRWGLWREAQRVFESLDTKPIVWRDYTDPQFQFDYRVYPKGAWVLHMLRTLMIDFKTMNEDRFTNMMRDFYQSYEGK